MPVVPFSRSTVHDIVAALAASMVVAGVALAGQWGTPKLAVTEAARSGHVVPTNDWIDNLTSPSFWRNRSSGGSTRASLRGPREEEREDAEERARDLEVPREPATTSSVGGSTYRTMCVRLCDGYFFPISFGTTRSNFDRDAERCAASCRSPTQLFVYPNPGGDPETMTDRLGNAYKDLPKAFEFRTKYDAACTCKPHPWDSEARALHRRYAEETAKTSSPAVVAKVVQSRRQTELIPTLAPSVRTSSTRRKRKAAGRQAVAQAPAARRGRPDGAMMLGANSKQRSGSRRQQGRASASSGGDWRARAFRGN